MVRTGETIDVTSHRHSVARLVPVGPRGQNDTIAPTRPMADLRNVGPVPLHGPVDAVGLLLEDRRRR